MSFRKRNAVISSSASSQAPLPKTENAPVPGVRPSPLDGRPTTSTGTASLDNLFAGHSGLPLGTSLFIGEHGTTDFAGILQRYYAAEGMVQGHQIHVLGMHESWRHELPGLSDDTKSSVKSEAASGDKMKIAWRYESLGSVGTPRERDLSQRQGAGTVSGPVSVFCHTFDLTKKLAPKDVKGQIGFHPPTAPPTLIPRSKDIPSPFKVFINDLSAKLGNSPPGWIHRIIVPNLLSPTSYDSVSSRPNEVLQFLHALRSLLRQHPTKCTAIITLPLSLYPRSSGLTRWMEILCDGVIELIPLQSNIHAPPPSSKSDSKSEEQIQGLLKVHTLPIFHEKGGGSHCAHDDQSFSLSRSKGFIVKPFYLPPADDEPEKETGEKAQPSMDF